MRFANGISRDHKTPTPAKELGRGLTMTREAVDQERTALKILDRRINQKMSANFANARVVHTVIPRKTATMRQEDLDTTNLARNSERCNDDFMKPNGKLGEAKARQILCFKPSPRASGPGLGRTRQQALCWQSNLSGKGK